MKTVLGDLKRASMMYAATIGLVLGAPASFAQSKGATQQSQALSEVVVTATRAVTATKTDTPLVEIPQTVSVVTSQQIQVEGAVNLQDALRYTAGFDELGNDSRGDFFYVRGFQPEIYVDGLKRNFGFVYYPRIDTYTMSRLEALVGPAAVLYGAGSAGGVVNMDSKLPLFDFEGEIGLQYGTWDRKQVDFDVTGPLTHTLAARVVGDYRKSQMQINFLPNDSRVVEPSITWKPNKSLTVTLIGLYQRDYTGPSQAYLPITASVYALPGQRASDSVLVGEPNVNRGPKRDAAATLLVDYKIEPNLTFHSGTRIDQDYTDYNEIYGTWSDPLHPFIDAANTLIARNLFAYRVHYRTTETDNHFVYKLSTGPITQRVLVGSDYSDFQQVAKQAFQSVSPINLYNPVYGNIPVPQFGPETTQKLIDLGVYGQDQIKAERVSLVLGVRHDHYTAQNTGLPTDIVNVTTYRGGLSIDAGHGLWPYASYSESFDPISGLNQFNQSYVPLYGKQYELGVKWQPDRSTMVRTDVYDIKERNELIPDPTNPVVEIQAGEVTSKGFEFQANRSIPGDIDLSFSYAHNSSRLTGQNSQQNNVPKDLASIFATKTFSLGADRRLRVGGGIRYVGNQVANDAAPMVVVTPSVTLVDAVASYTVGQWLMQLNVHNVFNVHYYSQCSAYGGCFIGDERTINGQVVYRFF